MYLFPKNPPRNSADIPGYSPGQECSFLDGGDAFKPLYTTWKLIAFLEVGFLRRYLTFPKETFTHK